MIPFQPNASITALVHRSRLLRAVRDFFDSRDFIEVQTPVLSQYAVLDEHIDPIPVSVGSQTRYLQTSPEQNMKRLLAAGMNKIYQLGPVFRNDECGDFHNPEFTMLEWYRVGDDMEAGMQLLEALVRSVMDTPDFERQTFGEAFQAVFDCDFRTASVDTLSDFAIDRRLVESRDFSDLADDWIDLLFSFVVQPELGKERPVLITNFPASRAALARLSSEMPGTCERFELFIGGIELANGYHELLDANELVARDSHTAKARKVAGKQTLPMNAPLHDAMRAGIPNCTGCAVGFDRFAMVASQAQTLSNVLAFDWLRA